MTIKEIKDLTRFLKDSEVDKIKEEIRGKEDILKAQDIDEEEMTEVLNTLFAILVIEKALESEIEGIENIRDELEQELLESYETYDDYMVKYKKQEKKNKKKWLLNFWIRNDEQIGERGTGGALGATKKELKSLKSELDSVKRQTSNENLEKIMSERNGEAYKNFRDCPRCLNSPHEHRHDFLNNAAEYNRNKEFIRNCQNGEIGRKQGRDTLEKIIEKDNNQAQKNGEMKMPVGEAARVFFKKK